MIRETFKFDLCTLIVDSYGMDTRIFSLKTSNNYNRMQSPNVAIISIFIKIDIKYDESLKIVFYSMFIEMLMKLFVGWLVGWCIVITPCA